MKNPLSFLGYLFAAVFGKIQWNNPPWVAYARHKAKNSPAVFGAVVLLVVGLIAGLTYACYWYKSQPEPTYVIAAVTVPEITPNQDELIPNNLLIDFKVKGTDQLQSVAPLAEVNKTITQGITIHPNIPGEWIWNSDSQLLFIPAEDWAPHQNYNIHFDKNLLVSKLPIEHYDVSFETKPFTAAVKELKLYQDPLNPEIKRAVASLEFSYPVNPESLEKSTSLAFQQLKTNTHDAVKFTYTYSKNKRMAYLNSESIAIKPMAQYLILQIGGNLTALKGPAKLDRSISQNLLIPDARSFLKILSAQATIIRNEQDRPEQILSIETSLGVNENESNKSVHMYLLPANYPATKMQAAQLNYVWQNPGEVTPSILNLSTHINKQPVPTEQNYSSLHGFKFKAPTPRYIYVKIDKGMKGFGGYTLENDYVTIVPVPAFPKEIGFLHKGSLLALGGEKKLSLLVRSVPAVKFDFARVLPSTVNQLITQTAGDFNDPYFLHPSFNQQNISQIYSETQPFDVSDLSKQQYTALDLNKYLNFLPTASGPQGLFLLQATGWDIGNNSALDTKASRMILITDLGLLVKDNNDGTHDVFVSSIAEGNPVENAEITVIGKNGLTLLSRTTDAQGRANFPNLNDFTDDREPIAYLAKLNQDVSFIPYNNATRQLNFSKFDVGGLYTSSSNDNQHLSAYIFSDRGIYRPGDTVHTGIIVKQEYAKHQAADLPLQITVQDPRGTTLKDQKITLNETGYMEFDFTPSDTAPTGDYSINLYLVKDDHPQNLLGGTTIKVAEFQPDRMRITSSLRPKPFAGWTNPANLKAMVNLWNLYGAPATDRKVKAKIILKPQQIKFDSYADYAFSDPLFNEKNQTKTFTEDLKEGETNDKGEVQFDLNLERFEKATYQLAFFAEGFEAEGGRSVATQTKTLISPLPYFVGYKSDGDLAFIKQNSTRTLNFIAINPQLQKIDVADLKLQLISLHPVTTLVKKPDGTFQYQSIIQSKVLQSTPIALNDKGYSYSLPSQEIGDFSVQIVDSNNTMLSEVKFSIVGASKKPLAKNAELSIKLNKKEYKAGDDIELQITAPYTGSGLITIERDKVYSTQWFKTDSTNSVQTIHVPEDFQGNGYVNVAFIRDWDSPELFVSPLSYSVSPFSVSNESQTVHIDLTTEPVAKPGEPFKINYKTDKPGKIIVFAVDEGILQVARYETPDPLSFFFTKHALEVGTQQTVDQILPKFIQDRELSSVGGDDSGAEMAGHLNPFKRKTDLPVVFWSGIIDSDSTERELVYNIPDYFNGTIRVMAVAVSDDAVGAEETSTEIRGDFIISPNVPTFVAPGDEFVVSASIANNLKDSGEKTSINISLTASPDLELVGSNQQTLQIPEGKEQSIQFKIKAKSNLGAAELQFTAQAKDKSVHKGASLSIRPLSTLMTTLNSGLSKEKHTSLDILQSLYPEYRSVHARASTSPLMLVYGLNSYLEHYPYGCTEQLVSKAMPLIAMKGQPWFKVDQNKINDQIDVSIQLISQRQMSDGGFSYWPNLADNSNNPFASVYAMHWLTEARGLGVNISAELYSRGISYLKELASKNVASLDDARIQAYAIYVLTRNEIVTTNYLTNLQLYLQKDTTKAWQNDITSAYLAASYQLLQSSDEANRLIALFKPQKQNTLNSDFYLQSSINAQYLYILAKHFPERLKTDTTLLMDVVDANDNNTVASGFSSLALASYPQSKGNTDDQLSLTEVLSTNEKVELPAQHKDYLQSSIDVGVKGVIINSPAQSIYFYQLTQTGFNQALPKSPIINGMEIIREYRNTQGHVVNTVPLGEEIEVTIQIRSIGDYLNNVVIEDLLPGGFEVVRDSVKPENMEFADAREDRVNFFGSISSLAQKITYKIKATNVGTYSVPPAYAASMYNPNYQARSLASTIKITDK